MANTSVCYTATTTARNTTLTFCSTDFEFVLATAHYADYEGRARGSSSFDGRLYKSNLDGSLKQMRYIKIMFRVQLSTFSKGFFITNFKRSILRVIMTKKTAHAIFPSASRDMKFEAD
jgi:hypothetical protein